MLSTKKPPGSAWACVSHVPSGQSSGLTANQSKDVCSIREGMSLEEQECYRASVRLFLLLSVDNHLPFQQSKGSSRSLISTQLLLGMTYLTEREKSPGALSLSLMRKAPSCLCLPNISSAFARGIFPKNHLCGEEKKVIGKVKNFNPFMEEPETPQLWKQDLVYALPHSAQWKMHFVSKSISCLLQIRC